MSTPDTPAGRAVLTLAHVIGMIDLVALPLWVGALMQHHRFHPAQAGLTATLFMLCALVASAISARLFNRLPHRLAASGGFALAAMSFLVASRWPMAPESFIAVALCHAIAGLGVGAALSFTDGCIGAAPILIARSVSSMRPSACLRYCSSASCRVALLAPAQCSSSKCLRL